MTKRVVVFWLGEFGRELFGFIPQIKKLKKEFYEGCTFICISYRGREVMYRGVYDEFIPVDLAEEEKNEIDIARMNALFFPSIFPANKVREEKMEQMILAEKIFNRVVEEAKIEFDGVICSANPFGSLVSNKAVQKGNGIYEHIKSDEFDISKDVDKPYVVIFPRKIGKPDGTKVFAAQTWIEIVRKIKSLGILPLYYYNDVGNKVTYDLTEAKRINDFSCFTKDNSVNLQTYLIKNAEGIIGSQVGALHLGFFAPAKHILGYFYGEHHINYDWQWPLLSKEKVIICGKEAYGSQETIPYVVGAGIQKWKEDDKNENAK